MLTRFNHFAIHIILMSFSLTHFLQPLVVMQAHATSAASAEDQDLYTAEQLDDLTKVVELPAPPIQEAEATVEVAYFSSQATTLTAEIGEVVTYAFSSSETIDHVDLNVSSALEIAFEELSNEISAEATDVGTWRISSNKKTDHFSIPLRGVEPGAHTISVDGDAETMIVVEEVGESADLESPYINGEDRSDEDRGVSDDFDSKEDTSSQPSGSSRISYTPLNGAQFQAAWNNPLITSINISGIAIGAIVQNALLPRSVSIELIGTRSDAYLHLGGQNTRLRMTGNANLTIKGLDINTASDVVSRDNVIEHTGTGRVDISKTTIFNRANSPIIVASNGATVDIHSDSQVYNQSAITPIVLSSATLNLNGKFAIGSGGTFSGNLSRQPITASGNSRININTSSLLMGGRATMTSQSSWNILDLRDDSFIIPWRNVSAQLTGVNGGVVSQSSSTPNDFEKRYLENHNSLDYQTIIGEFGRSIIIDDENIDEYIPKTLDVLADPVEGGKPVANETNLGTGRTTSINANPTTGYTFDRWEIASGANSSIADPTNPNTIFTMGTADTVVRAVYVRNMYSLTLVPNPPEGGSPSANTATVAQGQSTTINANPNTGYRFTGWQTVLGPGSSIDNLTSSSTSFTMGTANATIRANYERIQGGEVTVRHLDTQGNELAESVVLTGLYGDTYTPQAKTITGWAVRTAPPAGVFTEEKQTVDYVYERIQGGNIFVRYVNGSGTALVPDEILTGLYGDPYTTAAKTIAGWTLIRTPDNASGFFTANMQAVTYTYEQNAYSLTLVADPPAGGSPSANVSALVQGQTTTIEANPNKGYRFTGWGIVTGPGSGIPNPSNPSTSFTMGTANATIRANYERIQGGEVTVRHLDTQGNELAESVVLTGLYGDTYTPQAKTITGWAVRTAPPAGVFTEEKQTVDYVYERIQGGNIVVRYVNGSGTALVPNEILTGLYGDSYITAAKTIAGWTLTRTPDNASGFFTTNMQTVTYIYEQNAYSLTLVAAPPAGGSPSANVSALVQGQTTTIEANPNKGYRFTGWEIVSGPGSGIPNPSNPSTSFTMGTANATIRANYERIQGGEVTVRHLDTQGNELAESVVLTGLYGDSYTTAAKEISGWTLSQTSANANGFFTDNPQTVTYIYERNAYSLTLVADPPAGGSQSAEVYALTEGQTTTIVATPNTGYHFVTWQIVSGPGSSILNPSNPSTSFTMGTANTTVRAVYARSQGGSITVEHVNSSGTALIPNEVITGLYGDSYTTAAKTIAGWTLTRIPNNANGFFTENPQKVTYVYEQNVYTLSLVSNIAEGGNPSTEISALVQGQTTTINANTAEGYRFVGWEIDSGIGGTIENPTNPSTTFTMGTANTTLRAVYALIEYTVHVEAFPEEGGGVRTNVDSYTRPTFVYIDAEAKPGYRFVKFVLVAGDHPEFDIYNLEGVPEIWFELESGDTIVRAIFEKLSVGSIEVNHLDTNDVKLSDTIVSSGSIGDPYTTNPVEIEGYILQRTPDNATGIYSDTVQLINYIYVKEIVAPVDPIAPDIEINPEHRPNPPEGQGLLSIDFASQFDFGEQVISVHDRTYYSDPQRLVDDEGIIIPDQHRPNYVQVSDRRVDEENSGWALSIRQEKQFADSAGNELIGAQISFSNQTLATAADGDAPIIHNNQDVDLIPGEKQLLVQANEGQGKGTWIYRFGNDESAASSVKLTIPGYSSPEARAYQTNMVWELSSVPTQ